MKLRLWLFAAKTQTWLTRVTGVTRHNRSGFLGPIFSAFFNLQYDLRLDSYAGIALHGDYKGNLLDLNHKDNRIQEHSLFAG
jgi:hypothetical protein